MMRLTRNQWFFAALFALYTVMFHQALSRSIDAQQFERIWMFATGYGVSTFFTGLLLGAFDPVRRTRGVLAFQYNMITFVISVVVWIIWVSSSLAAQQETSSSYVLGMGFWGAGVLVHYLVSRGTIKGIPKKEIFD